jgi:hypothetical protein
VDYTPSSVRDNFSDTNAVVLETLRKPILISVYRHRSSYHTGSGSGLLTGTFSGDFGGGMTGS